MGRPIDCQKNSDTERQMRELVMLIKNKMASSTCRTIYAIHMKYMNMCILDAYQKQSSVIQ